MIAYTYTGDSVTLLLDGTPYSIQKDARNFKAVMDGIRANLPVAELKRLASLGEAIADYSCGNITLKSGVCSITIDGVSHTVPDELTRRLMDCMRDQVPHHYLLNFIGKLFSNPSRRAVQSLYPFLEHQGMPITPAGNFLGYKAIRADWTDKQTGTYANRVDQVLSMPRNTVDDDVSVGCSQGFHVGSLAYVQGFASGYGAEGGDRIVICEVDPRDVVAVPTDCNNQKLRTCRYRVVAEFNGQLPGTAVRDAGQPYATGFDDPCPSSAPDPDVDEDDDPDIDAQLEDAEQRGYERAMEEVRAKIG